jgi:cysteine dioxygenase
MSSVAPMIERCRRLAETGDVTIGALRALLDEAADHAQALIDLGVSDASSPYGRKVLFETDHLEVMVATWTRGRPCAPHDHGGSIGAVRVLQGRSRHHVWRVTDDGLKRVDESVAGPGDVVSCGPEMVHSMGDDGGALPLVTLHMYTHAIDHMIVYDTDADDTLIVEGTCGAWVPDADTGFIRDRIPGYHRSHALA